MREVQIEPIALDRLTQMLEADRVSRLAEHAARARALLGKRTVWNVNATASGGGVAEMLQTLLAYSRGARVDTRWLVLDGTPDFFRLTKRLHNRLHGVTGDGGPIGDDERALYERVLVENLSTLRETVRAGDIVILHDPQTAGLANGLRAMGAHPVWRCHIGRDTPNANSEAAWQFLRPYVEQAQATVFSRSEYAPAWLNRDSLWIIPPSLDPFSAKNRTLDAGDVAASLGQAGLVQLPIDRGSLAFVRRDGTPGAVRRHTGLVNGSPPLPRDARIVLQVSRWDRLKDMAGVLTGFANHLARFPDDVHLMLVGPDVTGVSDDPEGAEVLAECMDIWRAQPAGAQHRLHLCSLPMDDVDENAHLVNALQRYATVVVQKSIVEGFGLTVAEPMWKSRPVLATRVGGIQDQIVHGESGLLLDDPADLDDFADRLLDVIRDEDLAARLGSAAHERVRDRFLGDRHLIQYVQLFQTLDEA
jgi:trehalose synthase